jgi:NADH dehydrogenase
VTVPSEHTTTQRELARVEGTPRVPHVVIVGGGFGGLQTARALKRADVRITVVDRRNHHLFQPLLYQVASAVLSPADIAQPIRGILRKQRNATVLLAEAREVDVDARRIRCGDRWLEYDYLVLAAGMRNSWFGHDEWEADAPGLKTIDDALNIRRRVLLAFEKAEWCANPDERRKLLTFVVVGGGATGVELAGALSEISRKTLLDDFRHIDPRDTRVILVEGGSKLLPMLSGNLPDAARKALMKVGVEVRLGERVEKVDRDGVVVSSQSKLSDERIEAATVLWAAGVEAEPIGSQLGVPLDRSGRVIVGSDCSIPGHPEVMVLGDLAHFAHGLDGPLAGVAPVAIQQGRCVAKNIRRDRQSMTRLPFKYFDKGSMATIGRRRAVAESMGIRMTGLIAWLAWLVIHLMFLVGFRNRAVVLLQWSWSYFTFQRNARIIREDARDSVL